STPPRLSIERVAIPKFTSAIDIKDMIIKYYRIVKEQYFVLRYNTIEKQQFRIYDNWRNDAACRGKDPNVFFPIEGSGWRAKMEFEQAERDAKAICAGCPVRLECLDFGIDTRQQDGIWGGKNVAEIRKIRRQNQLRARRERKKENPPAAK